MDDPVSQDRPPPELFSQTTSGLSLFRVLQIHFPVLSRFMLEAELYPMLIVSKEMHAQIRREITHAQVQERRKWHRMRVEIEKQLACLKQIRSGLLVAEQNALDIEATTSCRSLITAGDFARPHSDHCRSVIDRGGRVLIPDNELRRNMSSIVRMLVRQVESNGQPMPAGAADSCLVLVDFLKLCFLSNPLLWRNPQSVSGHAGCTLLEMLMKTMLSRRTSGEGARQGIRMHAARATTEFLSWLIHLMLLQPPFRWHEWCHADQHLLLLCSEQITKRQCVTSAEMIVTPVHANDIAELKQLRWSIVRQCTGGPDAHSLSHLILRLNAPLLLPSFHHHALAFYLFYAENARPASVCAGCGLDDDHHSLLFDVFVCVECDFRMHSDCATTTREAQEGGFKARTAAEVQRMLQDSANQAGEHSNVQHAHTIPAPVIDELRSSFQRMFAELPSAGALGLMTLLLDSSAALCMSMQAALSLGPPPRDRRSPRRTMVQQWGSGWMKDNRTRQRLLTLLAGQSKLRRMMLRIEGTRPNRIAAAAA